MVAQAVLSDPVLLLEMAQDNHGHLSVVRMLKALEGQESFQAHMRLSMEIATLRASKHGRNVARYLEEKMAYTPPP